MNCGRDLSPPWRKINLEKQGAITEKKIKQNGITLVSETSKPFRRRPEIVVISKTDGKHKLFGPKSSIKCHNKQEAFQMKV